MGYETLVNFFNENKSICLATGLGIYLYGIITGYMLGILYSEEEKYKTKIKKKKIIEEIKEIEEIAIIERSTKFQDIKLKNHWLFKQDLVDKILNEYRFN